MFFNFQNFSKISFIFDIDTKLPGAKSRPKAAVTPHSFNQILNPVNNAGQIVPSQNVHLKYLS